MSIGEREPRPDKVEDVAEIHEILSTAGTVILTDFMGQDVKSLFAMRRKLREADGGYRVVKNKLFELAAKDTPALALTEGLAGPSAIVYTGEDPVVVAKALAEFTKGPKGIKVKSGVVEGRLFDAAAIESLAKVPSKPELLAMVVGGLQAPISNLVGTMQSMIGGLTMTLQAIAEKKQAA